MKKLIVTFALALALVLALPLTAAAQTTGNTDVGIWISQSYFDDTVALFDDVERFEFTFDEKTGYGLSVNRYLTPRVSTEVSVHRLGADMSLGVPDFFTDEVEVGEIEVTAITGVAQYHFLSGRRVSPYVGAGAAVMMARFDAADDFEGDLDIENELTWVANAGLSMNLTTTIALGLDAKYIPYSATASDGEEDLDIDVNPIVLSVGVRFRF
jgi:outer membrane protein W